MLGLLSFCAENWLLPGGALARGLLDDEGLAGEPPAAVWSGLRLLEAEARGLDRVGVGQTTAGSLGFLDSATRKQNWVQREDRTISH